MNAPSVPPLPAAPDPASTDAQALANDKVRALVELARSTRDWRFTAL